jgi:hypothetical protein
MNANDRKAISATANFSLKVWDETTVCGYVMAAGKASDQSLWLQGLFTIVNGDVAVGVNKAGEVRYDYKGCGATADELCDRRNETALENGGKGNWNKSILSKGVKVLVAVYGLDNLKAMSAQELNELVSELAQGPSVGTKYDELFPPKAKDEKDPAVVLAGLIATARAYADKHELSFVEALKAAGIPVAE